MESTDQPANMADQPQDTESPTQDTEALPQETQKDTQDQPLDTADHSNNTPDQSHQMSAINEETKPVSSLKKYGIPEYGWRVQLNHVFPEKWGPLGPKIRLSQMVHFVRSGIR